MFSDKKTSNEGDFFRNNFLPAGRNMPKHDSDRRLSGSIHLVFHCNAKNFIFQVLFSNRFLKKVRKEESGLKVDASGKPQQYKKPSAFRRNDYPFCFADGCFCYEVIEMTVCMWFAEACFRPYLEAGFYFSPSSGAASCSVCGAACACTVIQLENTSPCSARIM